MQRVLISDVIALLERNFPPHYQEDFDNTGLQVGQTDRPCTGVLFCVDLTPSIVSEAVDKRCNLIVTHHPLIFHPLKRITGRGRVESAVWQAIKEDITVYSSHTAADNTPLNGVSWRMASMLGLEDVQPLESRGSDNIGCGAIGNLPKPLTASEFVELVKRTFGSPVARCSKLLPKGKTITRVGLCGGAGSFLIAEAIKGGAEAFVTSDCKYNLFIDYADTIQLVDIGHYESEECTKAIFRDTISEAFPSLPSYYSESEINPIFYI